MFDPDDPKFDFYKKTTPSYLYAEGNNLLRVLSFPEVDQVTSLPSRKRGFCIDNLLVRIHSIIEMIWWTGLALWEETIFG